MWWLIVSGWLAFQAVSPIEILQHVQAGLRAEEEGRLNAAIADFQRVAQLDPTSAAAFMNLGGVYVQKREYGNAILALRRSLELHPDLAGSHELLGYALLAQGYAADAIPHLERVQVPGALGIALLQTGRLGEALAQLEAALAQRPGDPDLLFYLGQACAELAKQTFEGIVSAYPDSPRAHQIRGENHLALKRYDDAEREFRAALQSRPDLPGIHHALGEIYLSSLRYDDAGREFRAEAALRPGSAVTAWRLGSVLLSQGRIHDARRELERADKLKPGMPETLYELGKAAELDGDRDRAERAWLATIQAEGEGPLTAQAHFQLATLYRKQGKNQESDKHLRAFRSLQKRTESAK